MKTRERILQASWELFNAHGEPHVTTNHIADEIDISPGNLYYHFRNKADITGELFRRYEARMDEILQPPAERSPDVEDMWLFLHLLFETIWAYRFLYRDLNDILSRNRVLRRHFKRIMGRKVETAAAICRGLAEVELLRAETATIDTLAENMALVATYWISYRFARAGGEDVPYSGDLALGCYHVLSMTGPYLAGEQRALLEALAREYLR